MKKTYLYIIVAVIALAVIAALIVPQIIKKEEPSGIIKEQQNIEVEGPLQSEGKELNSVIIEDTDLREIDTEIGVL